MPKALNQSRHFQLAQQLRRRVGAMQPGAALPTFAQLQDHYGASQATVERAVQRLRREGLIHRPAGRKRLVIAEAHHRALHQVALVRPDYPSADYDAIARAVVGAARRSRTSNVAFEHVCYRSLTQLDLLRAAGDCDAAILIPTGEPMPEQVLAGLRSSRLPTVLLHEPAQVPDVCTVRGDDAMIGRLMWEHLAALGHRRIALLIDQPADTPSIAARIEGFVAASSGDVTVIDARVRLFDDAMHSAYAVMRRKLARGQPAMTAAACTSWPGAMATMRALREAGLSVPRDVSVIANAGEYDIAEFMNPPLTATQIDLDAYGRSVLRLIEQQIMAPDKPARSVKIKARLIERGSTARRRNQR